MASTSPNPFPTSGSTGSSSLGSGSSLSTDDMSSSAGMSSSSASDMSSSSMGSGTADSSGMSSSAGSGASMDRMVQSAHEAVDRFAEKAAPALEKLRSTMGGATDKLPMSRDDLSALQREWVTGAREVVREHPMASLAVAVAAGVILSRMMSSR